MAGATLVDAHVHLYPSAAAGQAAKASYQIWEYGEDPGVCFDTADGVIEDVGRRYADAGFDHAVVLQLFDASLARREAAARLEPGLTAGQRRAAEEALEESLCEALIAGNRWVVEAARADPLLTAHVCIDPLLLSKPVLGAHLSEMAGLGARGVKLHPVSQGYEPADPRLAVLYDVCCELDLVVLSHSGPGHRAGASARPREFAPVLEAWPNLRLVLAHLGGAAFGEAAGLAEDFPQVNFDLSEIIEWSGAPNAPSASTLAEVIRLIGADRVMLGSDFPWYDPSATAEKVAALPGFGEEERAALLGDSACRILGLEFGAT